MAITKNANYIQIPSITIKNSDYAYVRHKRRLHHARLQSLPVDAIEKLMQLHLARSMPSVSAAQPRFDRFRQQLLAQRLGLVAELVRVLFRLLLKHTTTATTKRLSINALCCASRATTRMAGPSHSDTYLDAPINLFAFHLLLAQPERRLAFDHFVQQTAEAEPVGREGVLLVVDDLGCHVT